MPEKFYVKAIKEPVKGVISCPQCLSQNDGLTAIMDNPTETFETALGLCAYCGAILHYDRGELRLASLEEVRSRLRPEQVELFERVQKVLDEKRRGTFTN